MNKTNILFVHPPFPVNHRHKLVLPISMCRIAAFLREGNKDIRKGNKDINVFFIDAHLNNLEKWDILNYIYEKEPNVVSIGYWTCQAPFVYNLSETIKKLNPDILIVHGGIHASFSFNEALKYCDVVVMGEGEKTFSELIQAKQKNKGFENVRGIVFKKEDRIIKTKEQVLLENLDDVPFPAFDLIDIHKYIEGDLRQLHVIGGKRMPILSSRGCPYDCSFCLSPKMWRRMVRWRSPEKVIEEIKILNKRYGFTRFQFYDDNFLLNPDFVERLSSMLASLDFESRWVALSRAAHVVENKELLPKIKKAGCVGIEMGLETADDMILEKINKHQKTDVTAAAVKLQKEAGLSPLYTIMVFNPGETIASIRKLREHIEEKIPESINYDFFGSGTCISLGQFATPYPGTPFFENRLKEGIVMAEDLGDLFHHQINFLPFSFLNDIPIAVKDISDEVVRQCVEMTQKSLFKYFPGDEKIDRKNRDDARIISEKYYSIANGERTIMGIARRISGGSGIDINKTLRFVSMATIVLAQNKIITGKSQMDMWPNEVKCGGLNKMMGKKGKTTLKRKTAIITGASRGIGKAIAEEFAEQGYNIALISRHFNEVEKVSVQMAERFEGLYLPFECDVGNPEQVRKTFEGIFGQFDSVDVLVNNAGINSRKTLKDDSSEALQGFDEELRINLRGSYICSHLAAEYMKQVKQGTGDSGSSGSLGSSGNLASSEGSGSSEDSGSSGGLGSSGNLVSSGGLGSSGGSGSLGGSVSLGSSGARSIINISSIKGIESTSSPGYGASKAGVIKLTKDFAKALAPHNIRVNCAAPGFIDTGMTTELSEEKKRQYQEKIPLARFGSVKEVAKVVAFLASDDASYITGQTIGVNGGYLM